MTPGAIAFLVDRASDPAVQQRIASALPDPRPEVRAAACRVISAAGIAALLPQVRSALLTETDPDAGSEMLGALAILGGSEDDHLLFSSATRLGPRAGRTLASHLAKARGSSAVPLFFSHREAISLDADNERAFFAQAIRRDASALAAAASQALQLEDERAWEAILWVAGTFESEPDLDLLLSGLRDPSASIEGASAWNLVVRWAVAAPVDVAGPLAALRAGAGGKEGSAAPADAAFGREVLARLLGAKATEKEAWISFIEGKEASHLDQVGVARAAMSLLTRAETKALRKRYERLYPVKTMRPSLSKPPETREAPGDGEPDPGPASARARTLSGYPSGFVSDVLAVSGCRPMTQRALALAEVDYTETGRTLVNGTVILPESLGPACREAARILFATSLPPPGHFTRPGWRETLLFFPHEEFLTCLSREGLLGSSPDHLSVGISPGAEEVRPPKVVRKIQPEYPRSRLSERAEGRVVMEIVVSPEGCVRDLRVRRSDGEPFSYEALWATSQWRYEPATKAGKPVAVYVTVVVDFKVH